MANVIDTITKYSTEALDTVLATESKTAVLELSKKWLNLNFSKAGKVEILDIVMDGLSNYYRANSATADSGRSNYNASGVHGDGYKVGSTQAHWQIYSLAYDRGKQFQIDEMDDEETAGLMIANVLKEFLRTQVVPEVDAVRFARIAGAAYTSMGNKVVETPNATKGDDNEIIHCFNRGIEWLKDHEVPEEDQVIFVSPAVETLTKNSEEIQKYISVLDYKTERNVSFKFRAYEDKPLIGVPSSRFIDKIVVGDNGYAPASGAKALNYIICSKKCVVPVVKLEKSKIFSPEVNQDFDGYKVNVRIYHDCFIPKNKICGTYVSVSTTEATKKASTLSVALEKSPVANTYILAAHFTAPAGKLGKVIWGTTAFTLGAIATATQLNNVVEDGEAFTTAASATKEYFALVDGTNTIIAISGEVTLPTE